MEIKERVVIEKEMLNELIAAAEKVQSFWFLSRLGEYKGWKVSVSIEKLEEDK